MALALEDPAAAPFVCCPDGLFASQVPSGEYPTSAIIVQILAWVLILLGGVLNKLQPGFVRPKGILGSFYHKRLGHGMVSSHSPIQILAVLCVLGFYAARFYGSFVSHHQTEVDLQALHYRDSNGMMRACAFAFYSVWAPMLVVQITLGTKNTFWFILSGLPQDRAAKYHALHGYLMVVVNLLAVVCFFVGGLTYRPIDAPFCTCTINPIPGVVSLVANIGVVALALPFMRRKHWEWFYLMGHFQLIPMVSFGALLFDRLTVFPWLALGFAMWGWSDLPMRFYQKVMQATKVVSVENIGDCTVLTMTKATPSGRPTLGFLHGNWEAGSYVWIAVRAPGLTINPLKGKAPPPFNKDWACYHPITIATPPIDADGQPAKDFTLVIKSMGAGTWSEALVKKALLRESPSDWKVWCGGPQGKLSFAPEHCDEVILCAGGIGCTPMMAIALMAHRKKTKSGEFFYPPVRFIWTIRNLDLIGAFEATLAELEESSNVSLSIFHTGTDDAGGTGSEPLPKGQLFKGRPNFYDLLAPKRTDGVVGVYSCGPKSMMKAVALNVARRAPSPKYLLHEETFEL